jgi:4'-phosphopantetheinyl transferase
MAQIKISNKFLPNIAWQPSSMCLFNVDGQIDVWRINVPAGVDFIDDFLKILSLNEIARASQYLRTGDRNRSVISRGALRIILGRYLDERPQAIAFEQGVNKKPILPAETGLFFSVSHSGDLVLIAVSNSEIGVDVEFIKPDMRYHDILPEYFVDSEIEFIQQSNSTERFYTLWTRKEALSKGIGTGLDSNLKYFPALDGVNFADSDILFFDGDWSINSFNIVEGYMASIASNPFNDDLRFWDFDLTVKV